MTPERLRSLQRDVETCIKHRGPGVYVQTGDALCDYGELRFLLAIAQRAGETCEWVLDAAGRYAKTGCDIRVEVDGQPIGNRPCWCGRKVAVRDGRT